MAKVASLAHTPTWVVAAVYVVIFSVSIAAERFLHYLGQLLKNRNQKVLFSALQRLKEDLLLLGFISFLLSVFQGYIVHICIPETSTRFMLPCKKENRGFLEENEKLCKQKGHVPMLSLEALYQLRIFILVLALIHVMFCTTTILFVGAKMRRWKLWENEIHQEIKEKLMLAELGRKDTSSLAFVLHQNNQIKFVNERAKGFWMKLAVVAFLKQFYDSLSKSDYEVLRSEFVLRYCPSILHYDFHKYMASSLNHHFKRVVGISWRLWLFVIFFLLLNIHGWHTYFWLGFLPLFLLLIVGAKLEHIITRLAQEAAASLSNGTERAPKMDPSWKEHFWFGKPGLVLHLIHFILFQNSFEIGFFFWVLVSEGFGSCMMERKSFAISRLVIGVIIEVICSYNTLPLYAIITDRSRGPALGVRKAVLDWITETQRNETRKKTSGERKAVLDWITETQRNETRKKTSGDPDLDDPGSEEVDATRVPNELFGATSPAELDEIVTVDGHDRHSHR